MDRIQIPLPQKELSAFCNRWKISELALFGSALREDFDSESDLDILVSFHPDTAWSLIDHARMQDELSMILGRPVDFLTKRSVERSSNWIRRQSILDSAQVIYVSR